MFSRHPSHGSLSETCSRVRGYGYAVASPRHRRALVLGTLLGDRRRVAVSLFELVKAHDVILASIQMRDSSQTVILHVLTL